MTTCTLCDLPTPDPPVTDDGVDGSFCCRGCLEVARTLEDVEAADAEDARAALGTGPDADAVEGEEAFVAVEGMHCATCEAFLESRATDAEGVLAAEASYPSSMVKVTYDETAVEESALPGIFDGLGYRARELDADGEREATESVGRLLVGGFFGMMTMVWYVLFLYPAYYGVDPGGLLLDVSGPAGLYLLSNIWLMTTVVLAYTGYPILRGAYVSLAAGHPNMDLLVALAASTAYVYSTLALLVGRTEVYFDIAVVVVLVVSVGNYYESKLKRRAAGHLTDLTEERVDSARRRTATGTETVAIEDLAAGDELVVQAGERVPVDGTVREGSGAVDESLLTGESVPNRHEPGDAVVGGGMVTDGALVVEVDEDPTSTLDRLVTHLWRIQSASPGAQRLADRIAAVFVPLVVVLAVGATVVHLLAGASATGALLTGLAVLVVSCPCALGLATPLAVASGVRESLRAGVVVTDGSVFESAPETDVVAFDKTGTLTTGEMELLDHAGHEATLRRAAAVEQLAEHPLGRAVTAAAGVPSLDVEDFERHPGRGVSATVAGDPVVVGREVLFEARDWAIPESLADRVDRARDRGHLPALVGWDGAARGVVVAGDRPRPGWESVLAELSVDREVVVLTGDSEAAARRFREHPDVDEVFAGVPPEAKAEVVSRLRGRGSTAMVGDGTNDAPALAAADLGIALESGTRLAADAADVVVTTDDLRTVPKVFSLTAATNRRIRQNLGWAFLYNAIAVPLAVVGLINPLLAALAMASSSLLVVGNSSRSLADAGTSGEEEPAVAAEGTPAT